MNRKAIPRIFGKSLFVSTLKEAYFHILYLIINAGGAPADMEVLTSDGRIDMAYSFLIKYLLTPELVTLD